MTKPDESDYQDDDYDDDATGNFTRTVAFTLSGEDGVNGKRKHDTADQAENSAASGGLIELEGEENCEYRIDPFKE